MQLDLNIPAHARARAGHSYASLQLPYIAVIWGVYWGYTGIMQKKMETTIVYWGYIGIIENKMETILSCRVIYGYIPICCQESMSLLASATIRGLGQNGLNLATLSK